MSVHTDGRNLHEPARRRRAVLQREYIRGFTGGPGQRASDAAGRCDKVFVYFSESGAWAGFLGFVGGVGFWCGFGVVLVIFWGGFHLWFRLRIRGIGGCFWMGGISISAPVFGFLFSTLL